MSIKTVAIFGGAFDPVHLDHVKLAKRCLELELCEELWFVPSPDRWDKKPFASAEDRLSMLDLVVGDDPRIRISKMELAMGDYRGSYVTMSKFKSEFPDLKFRLLVGADSYEGIPHWRDPLHFYGTEFNGEQLLREFELIVFGRRGVAKPDFERHREKGFAEMFWVGSENGFDGIYSSSDIRKELFFGTGTCPKGLDPKVLAFIREHDLYRL